jgi:hypothetical protein
VAGTLIGAALGSLALTVGNAVYSYSLDRTKERVAAAHAAAATRISRARSQVRVASRDVEAGVEGADRELADAEQQLGEAREDLADGAENAGSAGGPGGWRRMLAALPWKRIAVAATAVFAVAMLIILTFELVTGRAVSSYTGGSDADRRTSIPGLAGGGTAKDTEDRGGTGTGTGEGDSSTGGSGTDPDGGGTGTRTEDGSQDGAGTSGSEGSTSDGSGDTSRDSGGSTGGSTGRTGEGPAEPTPTPADEQEVPVESAEPADGPEPIVPETVEPAPSP